MVIGTANIGLEPRFDSKIKSNIYFKLKFKLKSLTWRPSWQIETSLVENNCKF